MTALLYTVGVLLFALSLVVSIGLHELGHMIPAKKFGAKVTQYFVGFGPTVWSKQVGETEYGIKAIPLGGFVKIVGMLPPGAEELAEEVGTDAEGNQVLRIRKSNTGMFTQLVSDARAAEWELVQPGDEERLFYRLPWWKKVIVMGSGPAVNIAIAFAIFVPVFATYGNSSDVRTVPVVSDVSACVVPAAENGRECTDADPVAPAKQAGIEVGDEIVSFNGVPVGAWEDVQREIRANDDGAATIVVLREGRELSLTTNTTVTSRPTVGADGLADGQGTVEVGFLGVSPTTELVTGGVGYTVSQMGDMTVNTLEALAHMPAKVWGVAKAIVGLEERDPMGPVSIVGGGRLAGEAVSTHEVPVTDRAVFLLMLIAGFNFFIGMFNFVPLLPLDGGHIAGALYEAVRRGLAKVFRRPDPGHFDTAKLMPVAYVVGLTVMVMGVVLIVGDLVVPVSMNG
ncbi:M50 family metallopeptidase [Nocardioides yefusunii]|uniref:M50 family metallopeptidase n=1 Tax=Nocardioides yefusunii TaxID=2500546 RepID=A0ABW1QVD2_9ACTN|nr:site-2 protease family protein [Nocardioides yefusunii]